MLLAISPKGKNPFAGHNIPLLAARGLSGSVAFFLLVSAFRALPLSTAIVLFFSYPVFAAMFGLIIYKEKFSPTQLACMGVLVAGVAILFDFKLSGSIAGRAMAMAAAVVAGLTVTLIRSLRHKNGPVIIYLYFCTMGTLLTLPMSLAHPIRPAGLLEWGLILGIIGFSVLAQLAMNQGFFYCKGFEGAAYMSSESVLTSLFGILWFNDPVSLRFFAGAFLIVGSGLALNLVTFSKK